MAITVRGEVAAHVDPDYRLEIRVRALQNAQIVYVVDLTSREPRLVQPGTFEATVQLQANMSNGYFSIETPVWHVRERREVGQSMKGLVRVQGAAFFGTTNLHPRVQIALSERTVGQARFADAGPGSSLLYINIQARQNQAGLQRSAGLLADVLRSAGWVVTINMAHRSRLARIRHKAAKLTRSHAYDLNIFLEQVEPFCLPLAEAHIMVPNQEWLRDNSTPYLTEMDAVLCKTRHAEEIFREKGFPTTFISFTSADRYDARLPAKLRRVLSPGGLQRSERHCSAG